MLAKIGMCSFFKIENKYNTEVWLGSVLGQYAYHLMIKYFTILI